TVRTSTRPRCKPGTGTSPTNGRPDFRFCKTCFMRVFSLTGLTPTIHLPIQREHPKFPGPRLLVAWRQPQDQFPAGRRQPGTKTDHASQQCATHPSLDHILAAVRSPPVFLSPDIRGP